MAYVTEDEIKKFLDFLILEDTVSPLVQLIKTNPELTEQVIKFAMIAGIRAAFKRINWDENNSVAEIIRTKLRGS